MNHPVSVPDTAWMRRCFDLASRGLGHVSPNPPVGAILVHEDRIIGEGFHRQFGGPHAEVEAIRNVPESLRHLIPHATLYVSLEPCCISGKTPPCTNLILQEGIQDVRISTLDPNPEVAGNGIKILREAGVRVTKGILESEGKHLIRSFTTNILEKRPQIILKWAQSRWGFTGLIGESVWLSDPTTRIWTHRQRAECDAVVVGARTVETDNPALTTRDFPGRSPQRIVYDPAGRLHKGYNVFADDGIPVWYFSKHPNPSLPDKNIRQYRLPEYEDLFIPMLRILFDHHVGLLLVEGGAYIQNRLIESGLWDEAWVIRTAHPLAKGIRAPMVHGRGIGLFESGTDTITGIENMKRNTGEDQS